ncbi:hypothetical protein RGQ29_017036 [Quercus rubra]|uniref:Uncharacterized protein n=1 Tax=Quercus rubra TaxID=3512 RepID=A0AAN7ISR3_QUERU|nr:hypothetical protein RGQ29_017036 [Quercus rubra]
MMTSIGAFSLKNYGMCKDHIIDIPITKQDLMCDELNIDVPLVMEPANYIYRAPKRLRKINKEVYTPNLISIGPFHLGDPELREMEMLKVSEDFVKMILLDSTSIIELFLRTYENDYIASNPMLHVHIQEDLILLENQLPFFILEELHEIFINGQSENSSFFDVACKYFSSYIKKIEKKEVKHFTDLIRYSYCPIKHNSFGGGISDLCIAKKLSEAGVIFKLDKKGDALDIEFLKFEINDGTESLLRNIMALEQCHYPREAYVCNFMVLLDYLIDTREDIGSNKAVAIMVNKLSLEIVEENSCYTDLAEELKNHYAQCCNHNMGYLRSSYFSNLWRGTVTVVGLIVLGFTFWSTIRPDVTHQIESVHCV